MGGFGDRNTGSFCQRLFLWAALTCMTWNPPVLFYLEVFIIYFYIHRIVHHCCFRQPGEEIQIGPNWDLSKALNNRYRLLLLRIDRYPGHFGVLLIKIHLLAFVVVAIKWIIRPKTKKNLFSWSLHLNPARNSSGIALDEIENIPFKDYPLLQWSVLRDVQ